MINNITSNRAAELLLDKNNILILCHKNPDGDTIGSAGGLMWALKQLGKNCAILCQDVITSKFDFLNLDIFNNQFIPEYIVAVDIATVELLGNIPSQYKENIDLCIDHHPSNTFYAKNTCLNAKSAATTQLMYFVIKEMGVAINKDIANSLYTGIITDSGCYQYSSTSEETHLVGIDLMKLGADHNYIVTSFFMSKSKKAIQLEKIALNSLEFYLKDRCAIVVLDRETMLRVKPTSDDINGISNIPRNIEGVDVAATIRAVDENVYKISLRTNENANASNIAQAFGGGGHFRAAGCEIHGNIEDVKKALLKEVEQTLCN